MERLPNKRIFASPAGVKIASVSTLKRVRKGPEAFCLRFRPFAGFADALCGALDDNKLVFLYTVEHGINVFPALTLAILRIWIEKLIDGNIQKGDDLIKSIEAGVLALVFHIHDGARSALHKLGQILLCPAFGFPLPLDFPAQDMKTQPSCILVHFHITPM